MGRRQPAITFIATCLVWLCCVAARAETSREIRARAANLTYNLDHDQAIDILRRAVAADPSDPANHRALASTIWFDILYRRGAVTVEHYLGRISGSKIDVVQPPADLDAEFKREIATAIELAEDRVKAAPRDASAHYDLGAALGLQASYVASVEGRLVAGFRVARRSYDEQERVLELDPQRKEAGLIIGTYRYLVSTLPLPMRFMAYVAGFGGGKERGLKMVEESAAAPTNERTDAAFALVLLYNREQRYDDALKLLDGLRRQYPRNRVLLLEAGSTAIRAHQPAVAEKALTDGLAMLEHDDRRKMPGEPAIWHYRRGVARARLGRARDAREDFRAALTPDTPGWIQGRTHLELARLASSEGDGAAARREADEARTTCEKAADTRCVEQAKSVVK
jgi:tetratricopeptide (TPR) repeat protein